MLLVMRECSEKTLRYYRFGRNVVPIYLSKYLVTPRKAPSGGLHLEQRVLNDASAILPL